jgi:hypothetical protein
MDPYFQNFFIHCQRTGSYGANTNPNAYSLILKFYHFVKKMTNNMELKTTTYRTPNPQVPMVMYLRAQVKVNYNGKFYPIIMQVLYPPNFPLVPPIFSLINWDGTKYDVHNYYYKNILPDKSYEVKLKSAKYFKQNHDIELMFSEFSNVVAEFFPFINRTPKPMMSVPFYFDPRYNDPTGEFPVVNKQSSQINHTNNNTPSNNTHHGDQPYNPHSNINTNRDRNISGGGGVSGKMPYQMKEFFNEMVMDLEKDKDQIEKDGEFLIRKKNMLASAKEQLGTVADQIESQEAEIDESIQNMRDAIEKMNSEQIDEHTIGNFFNYGRKNGEKMLEIETELKANLETQYTMMEVFEEREEDSDKYMKLMNRLWNKEWDLRLHKKFIIEKKAY